MSTETTKSNAAVPALLVPRSLLDTVLGSGAELVVETDVAKAPSASKTWIHIFDEYERRKKLEKSDVPAPLRHVHEQRLRELDWARSTMWEDDRMQSFLVSPDHNLWPDTDAIRQVAESVRVLKTWVDQPPDVRGADQLLKAVDVLEREAKYPGLYELKEAPVAGSLTAYKVKSWLEPSKEGYTALPDEMGRDDTHSVGPLRLLEVSVVPMHASDVAQLRISEEMNTKLLGLLTPSHGAAVPASTPAPSRWRALVDLHREHIASGAVGLFGDVRNAVSTLGVEESVLAERMHQETSETDACVRFRIGIYGTVIHRRRAFVLCGSDAKTAHYPEDTQEAARFAEVTGMHLTNAVRDGLVIHSPLDASHVATVLKKSFLSPALDHARLSECCIIGEPVQLSAGGVVLVPVTADFNPFLVLHGSRVLHGFRGRVHVMDSFKRQRDDVVEEQTEQAYRSAYAKVARDDFEPSAGPTTLTSSAATGGDTSDAIGRAVLSALAQQPMTKRDLAAHAAMSAWARLPQFDQMLKSALKKHAVYSGSKYKLRDA